MNKKTKSLHENSASLLSGVYDIFSMKEENSHIDMRLQALDIRSIKISRNQRILPISPDDISTSGSLIQDKQEKLSLMKLKQDVYNSLVPMARSIEELGMQNPISVYVEKGFFFLQTGQRRLLASLIARKKTVMARIHVEKSSNYNLEVTQWVENFHREGLSTKDSVNAVKQISLIWKNVKGKKITVTELAEALFCSKGQATKYFALIDAPQDITKAIEEGKLNSLRKAYELTRVKNQNKRKSLLKCVLDGSISQEKLSKIASSLTSENKTSDANKLDVISRNISLGSVGKAQVLVDIANMILCSEKYGKLKSEFDISEYGNNASIGKVFQRLLLRMESVEVFK